MLLITADWVLPVARPPIRDGAVLIDGGLIVEVGRTNELEGLAHGEARHDFPGCIVSPGLVNAHTHLSLTALAGLLPPAPLDVWIRQLVTATSEWGAAEFAASASLGAIESLRSGVTVVGDIVYGPEARAAAAAAGLGGTFFWEVLGVPAPRLYAELESKEYPAADGGWCSARQRCGLSPHAPYTCGPALIRAMHAAADEFLVPFAMHVAESAAETRLMASGTGPLADTARRLAPDFTAPGSSSIAYLDGLGVLDGCTVIQACHAGPTDTARMASTVRGVVTCPRSNRYLENPLPPVQRLLRAGIPVGVGTDSAASNSDLDLCAELRVIHETCPAIPPARLIEMATAMGALALGLEDRFGILEADMQADIAVFRTGKTSDPETDFVRLAGADTLEAVLTGGVWRVLDGACLEDPEPTELAAHAARIRAEHALGRP